ncbi:MAG: T9SS type A sorting domain-containing protein, partial [Paludibacter sp.]|nr:T9SS type A sorting domain-containing protein [Paludibacter sp.]
TFDENSNGLIRVFTDAQRINYVTDISPGETFTLPAGTYYFVFTDDGYYSDIGEYLDVFVDIDIENANGTNTANANTLKLYPNPAVENIAVEGLAGGETISVSDLNGKVVARYIAGRGTQNISVADLSSGVYLLTVGNGAKVEMLKFVKK